MHLKHPEILWALLLLLIPLIVHLFRLRRFKKEIFTNVRFLKEVELQTRKSSELKKWLILLTRMLASAMLVLAFAGPYLGEPDSRKDHTAYIVYLDNSHSLSLPSSQGTILQKAVNRLLSQWPENVPFTVITNDNTIGPGTKDQLRNQLLTLDYSVSQLDLNEIALKAQALFPATKKEKVLYLFTDLQRSLLSETPFSANGISVRINALTPSSHTNISVDSLRITGSSLENIDLEVWLSRSGDQEAMTLPVSVFSNSELLGRGPAAFDAGLDTVMVKFILPPEDLKKARISINDNGLPYDNTLYFNIPDTKKIRVLHIADTPETYLRRIYSDDEFLYTVATSRTVDLNTLSSQNLVIIDRIPALPAALEKGLITVADLGVKILQIPAANEDRGSFSALNQQLGLPQRDSLIIGKALVNTINYDHPLFKGVFNEQVSNFQYPEVGSYYILSSIPSTALELAGSLPFLYGRNGNYAFSAPVDGENTDLTTSALVVPVFYAIGLQSMGLPAPYYLIGQGGQVDVATTLENDEILTLDNGLTTIIPQQESTGNYVRLFPGEQIEAPGHFRMIKGEENIGTLSMNYPRDESSLDYINPENLENTIPFNTIDQGLEQVKSENKVNELWKWFVIFAIAFFLTEMLLLKYFK